jgi:C4-dicarboxylate-specific signal transduction histidine kinase
LLKELESLNKNITHIKTIISRQQSLAGATGFVEASLISELLEDALALGGADLERIGVTIAREYTMHFRVVVDRMKLMLILVNLISNAREALLAGSARPKVLKLRSEAPQGDRLQITVTDNGAGIAPENLRRIFSHGFTTKKTGHGFGLHSSAIAAREMGGSLTVRSDGPERGASFVIELPLHAASKTDIVP